MRFTVGYAIGSGDGDPDDGTDHSFRQTGVHGNEARLGGVEGFQYYGELLDPELSNLHIATVGWGIGLLESSSLDLVYHYYRQVELASVLRELGTASEPTGKSRSIGQEVDLILALEEWKHFGMELRAGAFRKGAAFGSERSGMEYLGFVKFRYAF
jgi:alginate production protein